MNKSPNHTQPLSNTLEEIGQPAVIDRNTEIYQQKVRGKQYTQNTYAADQPSAQSNKQAYLNGVPINGVIHPQISSHNIQPSNQQGHPHIQNPSQNPIIIRNNDQLIINGAPQTVVIINQNQKQTVKHEESWLRQQRVGCCCISMHSTTCCCDYYCVNSCCRAIQGHNLCCYCHSIDCVRCCVNQACRTCCFQKQACQCMLQCCKHMPLCLLIDCLKNNNCQCLQSCDGECIRGLCEGIGNIICCLFK